MRPYPKQGHPTPKASESRHARAQNWAAQQREAWLKKGQDKGKDKGEGKGDQGKGKGNFGKPARQGRRDPPSKGKGSARR